MKSLALALAATASIGLAAATTSPTNATAENNDDESAMTFREAPASEMDKVLAAEKVAARAKSQFDAGTAARDLAPGEYEWLENNAVNGQTEVVVDLSDQKAYVMKSGILVGVSTVSSGKPGHDTPTGTFEILQKEAEYYSNLYDDASMPFMQRLTWDGIALHAGHNPGYAASHGCIRLPEQFAADLFGETKLGTRVTVTA